MKLGIDIDGVLADFNGLFIRRVVTVTGRDLFPPRPFDIQTWNYPESFGYTAEEVDRVWTDIKADRLFWYSLPEYPDTLAALCYLTERITKFGDDVYFITARPGVDAKVQTESWLMRRLGAHITPTVLITSHKGLAAQTLGLDLYIDDRWENALSVAASHWSEQPPTCRSLLMDRPWNRAQDAESHGIVRVSSVVGLAEFALSAAVPTAVGASVGTSRINTSAAA